MNVEIIKLSPVMESKQVTDTDDLSMLGSLVVRPKFDKTVILNAYLNPVNMRCINVVSACIAGLGYEFKDEEQAEQLGIKTFLNSLYSKDGTPQPFEQLLSNYWLDYLLFGESYLEISRIGGKLQNIFNLSAKNCYISPDRKFIYQNVIRKNRKAEFVFYGNRPGINQKEVLKISKFNPLDDFYGVPSWIGCLPAIQNASKIRTTNNAALDNKIRPSETMLITGAPLTVDEKMGLREETQLQKSIPGRARVLNFSNPDVKVQIIDSGTQPIEGDYLKDLDSISLEIINAHGLTPELYGLLTGASISSGEKATGALKIFNQTEVNPAQNILQKQMNEFFRKEFPGYDNEFLLKKLDLTDSQQDAETELKKAQTYQSYLQLGNLDLFNEYRESMEYEPITPAQWQEMQDNLNGANYAQMPTV